MRNERFSIDAPRLILLCCDEDILEALFKGDEDLAALLQIDIPLSWTEFGEPAFRWTYSRLLENTQDRKWLSYLPILKDEKMLVGSCGFKGRAVNGVVEMGYEVAVDYRGRGLATEMATALMGFALAQDEVTNVLAHTLAIENESCKVLKKIGMQKIDELEDPDDGPVWKWEMRKGF